MKNIGGAKAPKAPLAPTRLYKEAREKVRKLNDNLNEGSKAIKSSFTTDAEAIELMELTSKDIGMTVNGVEQEISFIEPGE